MDKALKEKPDLIISDINMPNMNGIEMIRNLRSQQVTKYVPILVLTRKAAKICWNRVKMQVQQDGL